MKEKKKQAKLEQKRKERLQGDVTPPPCRVTVLAIFSPGVSRCLVFQIENTLSLMDQEIKKSLEKTNSSYVSVAGDGNMIF